MKSILVIRLSAIGDVVFASPIIAALRRTYPDAHIAWLVEPGMADLLRHHPDLDEVILLPRNEWRGHWRERRLFALLGSIWRFARTLRSRGFDTAIDMQGLLKSGVWAWLSGAARRIGLGSREGSRLLMTETYPRAGDGEMIGSEYRYLAGQLGLDAGDFAMAIGLPEASVGRADDAPAEAAPIVLCPFTTRPQKHWFESAWRELVPHLQARFGGPIVLLGGPADRKAATPLAHALPVVDLVGKTTLLEAAALIRGARLVIGVDTGLTHMGTAFGRPTVCLFGSTRPYLKTASPSTRVLYHALACSPCRRRPTCAGAFTCMGMITPDEVMDASALLLNQEVRS